MSVPLIKQLGIDKSSVRATTESFLNIHANRIRAEFDPAQILKVYDSMKADLISYYKFLDKTYRDLRAQRMRLAIKLSQFDTSPDAPLISTQLVQKEQARVYLKKMQRNLIEDIKLKSNFNWVRDGEHSNKLFFRMVQRRVDITYIPEIKFKHWVSENHTQKKILIAASFAETFSKRIPSEESLRTVISAIETSHSLGARMFSQSSHDELSTLMDIKTINQAVAEDPSEDWLTKVISTLKMYKAAGADGIPNEFYYLLRFNKDLLYILKRVYEVSLDLGILPDSMSITYYKLLYKKGSFTTHEVATGALHSSPNDPRLLHNWRPIALLPCDSKILSAYVAQKLKTYMEEIITRTQQAFVPGRTILDNVMLMRMIIHHHMTTGHPAGLVFLDFAHAYDFISQEYILAILNKMNFPANLINIIKTTMTNQKGKVIVNGDLTVTININNGGKQGDPLFPLIYISAMEGLYALLDTNPLYKGIRTPSPERSYFKHQGYADDTAIAIGSDSEIAVVESIFKIFETASGNAIKPAKSFIIWVGSWANRTRTVYGIPPLPLGTNERYLGLQIGHDITKIDQWTSTIKKIKDILKYWNRFNLTIFGRTLLLNSSLLSQLWYKASLTEVSTREEKELLKLINSYFRKGKRNNTVSAATRVLPHSCGGLGQINAQVQLKLLRIKWIIRSNSGEDSLWIHYWDENVRNLKTVPEH